MRRTLAGIAALAATLTTTFAIAAPATATPSLRFHGAQLDWLLEVLRVSTHTVTWSMDRVSDRVATDGRRLYVGIGTFLEAYDVASGKRA